MNQTEFRDHVNKRMDAADARIRDLEMFIAVREVAEDIPNPVAMRRICRALLTWLKTDHLYDLILHPAGLMVVNSSTLDEVGGMDVISDEDTSDEEYLDILAEVLEKAVSLMREGN